MSIFRRLFFALIYLTHILVLPLSSQPCHPERHAKDIAGHAVIAAPQTDRWLNPRDSSLRSE
jgi:hypothetical protein